MNKERTKKMLRLAVLIYAASFLIINWNDVSWIFNYKEVSGIVSDFFNPYPSIDASNINAYFHSNSSQNLAESVKNIKTEVAGIPTEKQNTLEIPKISISAPIIFSTSVDKDALAKDLDSGVIYYPGSVYPGQEGQIVILGHSAPLNWPKIKYDWVFTDLDKLSDGDAILISLNNRQYTYIVKQTTIIKKGADIPGENFSDNNNVLTLISCWPPGKDYQRIVVQAVLSGS